MVHRLMLASFAALAVSSTANAAITIYTSQESFLAAISAPATDTFQNLSITRATPSPLTRTAGTYGYMATASTSTFFGAGTSSDPWLATNVSTDTITLSSFTGGVYGVGGNFFTSNIIGDFAVGDITLSATDADGTVTQTILRSSTTSFLGFVSTTGVSSVSLSAVPQPFVGHWPTADNLILGGQVTPAIPEPATWAMMIAGFGLIGASMRRKAVAVRFA